MKLLIITAAALQIAAGRLAAQTRTTTRSSDAGEPAAAAATADAETRRVLGVLVALSGSARDTIGVLVSSVVPDGAADRAGITEGNRIAEVNGVSVRVDPQDVGHQDAERVTMRLLARQLRGLRPGDPIALRLFAGGRFRSVRLQAAGAEAAPVASAGPLAPSLEGSPAPAPAPTLGTVMEALARIQAQLRQLTQDGESTRDAGAPALPGLRVSAIDDDLAQYFGDGSEQGLLVLEASALLAPLRSGDVIIRVDGEPADVARLRTALEGRRPARIELLRRKRIVTVTLPAHD